MTIEEPKSTNEASVPNGSDERTSQNAKAVLLRNKGMSYQEIANELGVSKSTAFRLVKDAGVPTKTITKGEFSSESLEGLPPLPNEPVELLSDFELKDTEKRLKTELRIKRMRARARWLDYVTQNPQHYQSYMAHDGQGKRDDFRDRVLLEDRKMLFKLLENKKQPQTEGFGAKDFFSAVLNLQANQQKSNWEFYSRMVEALGNMRGSDLPPEATIALKKMEMEFQKWQTEKAESGKRWEAIMQAVAPGLSQIPAVVGGLFGKKGAGNPNKPGVTQMQCQQCGVPFPVAVKDLEQKKPIQCPVCHSIHRALKGEDEHEEDTDKASSDESLMA